MLSLCPCPARAIFLTAPAPRSTQTGPPAPAWLKAEISPEPSEVNLCRSVSGRKGHETQHKGTLCDGGAGGYRAAARGGGGDAGRGVAAAGRLAALSRAAFRQAAARRAGGIGARAGRRLSPSAPVLGYPRGRGVGGGGRDCGRAAQGCGGLGRGERQPRAIAQQPALGGAERACLRVPAPGAAERRGGQRARPVPGGAASVLGGG